MVLLRILAVSGQLVGVAVEALVGSVSDWQRLHIPSLRVLLEDLCVVDCRTVHITCPLHILGGARSVSMIVYTVSLRTVLQVVLEG